MKKAILFRLYRYYDENDVLLYIGLTANFPQRNGNHSHYSLWFCNCAKITLERFSSKDELAKAEKEAVINEKPLFNITYSTTIKKEKKKRDVYVPTKDHIFAAHCIKKYGIPEGMIEKWHTTKITIINMCKLKAKTNQGVIERICEYFKRKSK